MLITVPNHQFLHTPKPSMGTLQKAIGVYRNGEVKKGNNNISETLPLFPPHRPAMYHLVAWSS